MAEESVHHAVSHKLFLELIDDRLHYTITDKHNDTRDHGRFDLTDAGHLKEILSSDRKFQSIYSSVYLVNHGVGFTLVPQSVVSSDDKLDLFQLNYKLRKYETLYSDYIGTQIQILFAQQSEYLETIRSVFPELHNHHVAYSLHDAITSQLSDDPYNIVAHIAEKHLLIMAFTQGKMVFCNQFDLNGDDDVFYYVMLAVEQLEFDPSFLELIILSESREAGKTASTMENYIGKISTPNNLPVMGDPEWQNKVSFATQSMIQCV